MNSSLVARHLVSTLALDNERIFVNFDVNFVGFEAGKFGADRKIVALLLYFDSGRPGCQTTSAPATGFTATHQSTARPTKCLSEDAIHVFVHPPHRCKRIREKLGRRGNVGNARRAGASDATSTLL